MGSRKGGKTNSNVSGGAFPELKIKETESSLLTEGSLRMDQLCHDVTSMNTNNGDDGEWECAKKSKNRSSKAAVHLESPATGRGKSCGKSWAQVADQQGKGNYKPQPQSNKNKEWPAPNPPLIPPPLQNGWQWASRSGSYSQPKSTMDREDERYNSGSQKMSEEQEDDSNDDFNDSDDDFSDEYDSDMSVKSFETRKKNKWFKEFFEAFESLSVQEINEPTRQWHCPACQGGPGAIDWYRGLSPLISHAKTKGSNRVKLHRELAELLEEAVVRKGTSVVPIGEVFGKWKGLSVNMPDREIVWPPMVIIMNTLLDKDDNDKVITVVSLG